MAREVLTDVVLLIGDLTLGDAPQLSFLRMFRLARLASAFFSKASS